MLADVVERVSNKNTKNTKKSKRKVDMYHQHHVDDGGGIEMSNKMINTRSSIEGNAESTGGGDPGRAVCGGGPKVRNEEVCSFGGEDSSKEVAEVGKQQQQEPLLNSEEGDLVSAAGTYYVKPLSSIEQHFCYFRH